MAIYGSIVAVFLPSWTSPWRFRRIVSMSKSGVGDIWMITTTCVAFTRRKTAEKILQLTAFDKMNWPPRAEDTLYPGSLQNYYVAISVTQVAASTRDFLDGFLPLQPPVCNVQPRKQSSTSSHIQDTSLLSRVCAKSGNVQGACIGCFLPLTRQDISWIPKREGRKVGESEQRGDHLYWIPCIGRAV